MKSIDSNNNFIDVTHGLGAPFGGIGTGYFVYGRHGFVNVNLNGFPDEQQTNEYPKGILWDYKNESPKEAPFALYCKTGDKHFFLQERTTSITSGIPARSVKTSAYMPFGKIEAILDDETEVNILMYSSAKPHDVERTSIPACVFEFDIINKSTEQREYNLGIDYDKNAYNSDFYDNLLFLSDDAGNMSFGFKSGVNGTANIIVPAGESRKCVATLSWFYPTFKTTGIAPDDIIFKNNYIADYDQSSNRNEYRRNYTLRYSSSLEIAKKALAEYEIWHSDIDSWHNSFDVPAAFKRVWFGSYASVITASLYTVEGYYLEIEQPHGCLSTMDVCAYSGWIYLINWPEIEAIDLRQYAYTIPESGKVWHSLWKDNAHYVEEAVYALRVWRYVLWTGDKKFLEEAFDSVKRALEFVYNNEGRGYLLNNVMGNQSYDAWKMPGTGAYINNQWIYALNSYKQMCACLGKEFSIAGNNLNEFLESAIKQYNDELWNEKEGYWIAYKPNEKSDWAPFGDAVFSDQLFGHWMVICDKNSKNVIELEKEKRAIEKIYIHNRIEDPEKGGSCWANGVLPEKDKTADTFVFEEKNYRMPHHALTCWIGAQLNLASMLSYFGLDTASEDVFCNLSKELGNNVLAAGEWNRKLSAGIKALETVWEVGKDTPRFPPYPRYKSSWEYITRLLGVEIDFDTISFNPMKNIDFSLTNVCIAGISVSVSVKKNWSKVVVNGKVCEPTIDREQKDVELKFL